MKKTLMPVLGLLLLNQAAFAEQKAETAKPAAKPATATEKAAAPKTTTAPQAAQKPAAGTPAAAPQADERVKVALDRLKLKYAIGDRGTYSVVFNVDKRRQTIFVNSSTQEFNGTEIRLVTSTAFKVDGNLPVEKANALLNDNNRRKLGGWRVVGNNGANYVVYAIQLPANADDNLLRTAIAAAMQSADALELEETGKDEY